MNQNISETSIFPFGTFEIPVAAQRHILDHVKYFEKWSQIKECIMANRLKVRSKHC